ncbi:MAG: hypothetical protein M3304_03265, partial [Actinomycetota bacterium]|nr:hypothetical protein [Actinomycetota bacterium]
MRPEERNAHSRSEGDARGWELSPQSAEAILRKAGEARTPGLRHGTGLGERPALPPRPLPSNARVEGAVPTAEGRIASGEGAGAGSGAAVAT